MAPTCWLKPGPVGKYVRIFGFFCNYRAFETSSVIWECNRILRGMNDAYGIIDG
jgi:hypothetical protein